MKDSGEEMIEGDPSSIEANAANDKNSKVYDFIEEIKRAGLETYHKFLEIIDAHKLGHEMDMSVYAQLRRAP